MKISDEDLNHVRMLYCEEGAHDEDTRVADMYEELMALRKVAEAARHFIDTMENFTKATHWLFEIDEALKEAGYDA